jgi:hypothetical protein
VLTSDAFVINESKESRVISSLLFLRMVNNSGILPTNPALLASSMALKTLLAIGLVKYSDVQVVMVYDLA